MPAKWDTDTTPGIRLLKVFRRLLLNGRRHYLGELAKEFQCSRQTVLRIMEDIEQVVGPALESGTENRHKWYRLKCASDRLGQKEEVRYLAICRDLAAPELSQEVLARMDDTIASLSSHLERPASPAAQPPVYFFHKGKVDYAPHRHTLEQLMDAIEKRQLCRFTYAPPGDPPGTLVFAPDCLICLEEALYAYGAVIEKDMVRDILPLPVHHIRNMTVTGETFDLLFPEIHPGLFGLPRHAPRRVRLGCRKGKTADYLAERIWTDDQTLARRPDGSLLLEMSTSDEEGLKEWLKQFGEDVTLLAPSPETGRVPPTSPRAGKRTSGK